MPFQLTQLRNNTFRVTHDDYGLNETFVSYEDARKYMQAISLKVNSAPVTNVQRERPTSNAQAPSQSLPGQSQEPVTSVDLPAMTEVAQEPQPEEVPAPLPT